VTAYGIEKLIRAEIVNRVIKSATFLKLLKRFSIGLQLSNLFII